MTDSRTPRRLAAVLAALLIAGGGPALAQTTADQPVTPAPMTKPMGDAHMGARLERHIAELHRRLHITAGEEANWNAFAQVMRNNAAHMDQVFRARSEATNMNAVDDLRSYAAIAQAHAEDVQHLIPAFQTLYSSLTPDQQHTADSVFRDFEHRRDKHPTGN